MTKFSRCIRTASRCAGALVLCAALLLSGAGAVDAGAVVTGDSSIRVGLTYHTGAQAVVTVTAGGFLLGRHDEAGDFVQTGQTDCAALTFTYYAGDTILVQGDGGFSAQVSGESLVLRAADGGGITYDGNVYLGDLELRSGSGGIDLINQLPLDDYVAGVLPYEMYATWPLETLKAGAVAARTYAMSNRRHQEDGFDVCNTTCCQVYNGVYTGQGAENIQRAADETSGICAYYNDALIEALYHASSGGQTEDSENVWSSAMPYLRGKSDPYDQMGDNPYTGWSYSFSAEELTELVRASGQNCGQIVSVEVTARTATGNVGELTFTDAAGQTYVFTKDAVRTVFRQSEQVTVFSRNFTIIPPGGQSATSAADSGTATVITGSGVVTKPVGTVVTADGTSLVSGTVTAVTGQGQTTVELGGSSAAGTGNPVTNTSNQWIVTGSGYGHSVGMSQWGAYNMGLQGFTYDEILEFYFTGITLK